MLQNVQLTLPKAFPIRQKALTCSAVVRNEFLIDDILLQKTFLRIFTYIIRH